MTRAALVVLAAATVCVPLASGTNAAFPGKAGKLIFQSDRSGNYELYTATASGSGVKKLLSRPQTDEFNASWSPSGSSLAFQSGPRDGSDFDIWVVGADGKNAHAVLTGKTNDRAPQFCDFRTVVFTRQISPTSSDVYSLDLGTRRARRLTSHPSTDSFPTCHPKRDEIAFISARDGLPRIYVMTRAGARQRPLVAAPSLDPDYSTDGTALAYIAPDADRNLEVFTMNLSTGAVTQRTNVKAPFEFRLPKFVPVAARSVSARSGPDDNLVATQRDASTTPAKETVWEVVTGPTRPVGEPASGGSVQPDKTGYCTCKSIDADIVPTTDYGIETRGPAIDVHVDVTIGCTRGQAGCRGTVHAVAPRSFRLVSGGRTLDCYANCAKTATHRAAFVVSSGNPDAGRGGVVLPLRFTCENRNTVKYYKLFFRPSGLVDQEKSDLNGNRVPDGKEK